MNYTYSLVEELYQELDRMQKALDTYKRFTEDVAGSGGAFFNSKELAQVARETKEKAENILGKPNNPY